MKRLLMPLPVLGSLALLALAACNSRQDSSHEPVERVDASTIRIYSDALSNVKTAKAAVMDFPDLLSLMGKISITEDRTTIVPARVSGRIESIAFASGEFVKAGDSLATLFSPDFVAAREEYLQSFKQEKAGGTADSSDFANLTQMARKKLETMGLSSADVDQLPTAPSDPAHSLMTIRAPRSGVIVAKSAVLGNLVNVGDTLFMIGDMSKVWFSGDLYPEDLPKVHKGQGVVINVEGYDKPINGTVSFISPLVDPTTRSIKIRALMDNPKNSLKADMYVQGNIVLNQNRALLVPTPAIVRTGESYTVYKRVSPPSLEKQVESVLYRKTVVQLGNERQGMTAVTQGLQEGDEVVSEGAWLLDGALSTAEKQ